MKVEELLTRTEGKTLEFKQDVSSPRNIIKTITAFANTAGGVILIGIEDGTKAVLGLANPLDEEERLCSMIADLIEPRLVPNVELLNWKGRTLLAVEVYPSALRPHWLKTGGIENGVLVRVGSTNRQADKPLIAEMRRSALNLSYDEEPMPDINPDSLDVRVASGLFSGFKEWSDSTPESLHLVCRYQGRLVPTVGGVLLFGKDRERHFPDAWIQCGRFRGTNKAVILDQQDLREHLPQALEISFEFVKKHASRAAVFGELRRTDIWSVPLAAVREALTNAIVHADYSQVGSPIRIAIYDDRIEIENPGLLVSGLTIENLRLGVSKLRNRVIGRIFKDLNLIEQWGSGFERMYADCEQGSFPVPIFEEVGYHFRVTLPLTRNSKVTMDPIEQQILSCILQKQGSGGASMDDLTNATGLVARSVRRHLARLINTNRVVAIGKNTYDPNKKYLAVHEGD